MSNLSKRFMIVVILIQSAVFIFTVVLFTVQVLREYDEPIQEKKQCLELHIIDTYVTRYGVKNDLATKAFKMSNGDMDFLKTVEMESEFDIHAIGDNGLATGLCQWRIEWHSETINDSKFKNADWQLQKCFELYSGYMKAGNVRNRLYGYRTRNLRNHTFKVVEYTKEIQKYNCE